MEGKLRIKGLLFIPKRKPFDSYQNPDKKKKPRIAFPIKNDD